MIHNKYSDKLLIAMFKYWLMSNFNRIILIVLKSGQMGEEMKRNLAILLLATTLVMTACGNENAQKKNVEATSSVEESTAAGNDAEESTEESSDAAESETGYVQGVFTETGYESEYMGYRFTTPEGCILMDQDQLLQLMGISMDTLSEDYSDALIEYAKQSVVYDLFAAYPTTNTNVNIVLQPMDTSAVTLDAIVDASVAQLEGLTTMDITVSDERETVEIAGQEYVKLSTDTVANGISMKQELYLALLPDKMVNLTISYMEGNEAERDALLKAFEEL